MEENTYINSWNVNLRECSTIQLFPVSPNELILQCLYNIRIHVTFADFYNKQACVGYNVPGERFLTLLQERFPNRTFHQRNHDPRRLHPYHPNVFFYLHQRGRLYEDAKGELKELSKGKTHAKSIYVYKNTTQLLPCSCIRPVRGQQIIWTLWQWERDLDETMETTLFWQWIEWCTRQSSTAEKFDESPKQFVL